LRYDLGFFYIDIFNSAKQMSAFRKK